MASLLLSSSFKRCTVATYIKTITYNMICVTLVREIKGDKEVLLTFFSLYSAPSSGVCQRFALYNNNNNNNILLLLLLLLPLLLLLLVLYFLGQVSRLVENFNIEIYSINNNDNNYINDNWSLYSAFGNSKRFTVTLKCGTHE